MKRGLLSLVFILAILVFSQGHAIAPAFDQNLHQTSVESHVDVFTQKGGKGSFSPSDSFGPGEQVIIYANVTYNDLPVNEKDVTFEVYDPYGDISSFHDATNTSGIAAASFYLPWPLTDPEEFGIWCVTASANVKEKVVVDTLEFEYGYLVEVLSVETGVHSNGKWFKKTLFQHSASVEAVVRLKSTAFDPKNVCLAFTIIDNTENPVLFKWHMYVTQGKGIENISVRIGVIPKWATLGEAKLYVNALTKPPSIGGIPWCPQVQQHLMIWWNPADINYDFKVNFLDAVLMGAAYSATPSDPNWNPDCDIAEPYRTIDIFDIVIIAKNYGDSYA